MNLKEQIEKDFLISYKAKDETVVSLLRLIKSAIRNHEINLQKTLDEAETIKLLRKEAKQREDAIAQYTAANREDLASKEKTELLLIRKYLPEEISVEKLFEIVKNTIAETGAKEMKDMGKVIAEVIRRTGGNADGSTISKIVKEQLQA